MILKPRRLLDGVAGPILVPGPVVRGSTRAWTVFRGRIPLKEGRLRVAASSAGLTADLKTDVAGQCLDVEIRPDRAGRWTGTATFVLDGPDDQRVASETLQFLADVTEAVVSSPDLVLLGAVSAGAEQRVPVVLRHVSGKPFEVVKVDVPTGIEAGVVGATKYERVQCRRETRTGRCHSSPVP